MKFFISFLITQILFSISLIGGENVIPDRGDIAEVFLVKVEGKGAGEISVRSGTAGGIIEYTGNRGNITQARYSPSGKPVATLVDQVALDFQLEGTGSLGIFVRSTDEGAYLLLLNRSAEGQGNLRLFKRSESSQASFTAGMLASQTFEWPQSSGWNQVAIQVTNQADGSVVLQTTVIDEAKSLIAEINKIDSKAPLTQAGGLTLRFYASEVRPATIRVGALSFSPVGQ